MRTFALLPLELAEVVAATLLDDPQHSSLHGCWCSDGAGRFMVGMTVAYNTIHSRKKGWENSVCTQHKFRLLQKIQFENIEDDSLQGLPTSTIHTKWRSRTKRDLPDGGEITAAGGPRTAAKAIQGRRDVRVHGPAAENAHVSSFEQALLDC